MILKIIKIAEGLIAIDEQNKNLKDGDFVAIATRKGIEVGIYEYDANSKIHDCVVNSDVYPFNTTEYMQKTIATSGFDIGLPQFILEDSKSSFSLEDMRKIFFSGILQGTLNIPESDEGERLFQKEIKNFNQPTHINVVDVPTHIGYEYEDEKGQSGIQWTENIYNFSGHFNMYDIESEERKALINKSEQYPNGLLHINEYIY